VGNVIKDLDSHGPMIACAERWLNGGRYDDHNTAWGDRYELYQDSTVYRRKMLFHREEGLAFLRRQKWETLQQLRRDFASWKDFRDAWLVMQVNKGCLQVDVSQAKKER
jgi:hypothetical protein